MREVPGTVSEIISPEIAPYRFEIRREHEEESGEQPDDPYAWMNPCDRWMIGRPADRACWEFYDRISAGREEKSRIMMALYALGALPPPLNILGLAILLFQRR